MACGYQGNEGVAVGDTGFAGNLADWVAAHNVAPRARGGRPKVPGPQAVPKGIYPVLHLQGIVAQRAGPK